MHKKFNSFKWHDAELLSVYIDRSDAGNKDTVCILIKWPDDKKSQITFNDCYLLNINMNFGIIAEELILEASCVEENDELNNIKQEWSLLGVDLNTLCCYRVITNSTNSVIDIYAMSFFEKHI